MKGVLSPDRQDEWRTLAQADKKVTVFQGPGFVLTWYDVYDPEYEPLLFLARDDRGNLLGVMPLAISRRVPQALVFAGVEQAEYAGWLAVPALQDEFPARCVVLLRQLGLFGGAWSWRWLAPGTNLSWLEHPCLHESGIAWRVSHFDNPLWTLHRVDGVRFFDTHKSYKWKLNRLRRLGDVQLVQLDSSTLTDELFEAFKTLYDVRQLARHGFAPFRDNPLKGIFHRRLLERAPESVLLFALMAGVIPIAFNYDLLDKRRAIGCMSPFDQRWLACSPGKMIGDLVADTLRDRDIEEFDLTPGGDEYKEEIANRHETVHSLRLFPSTVQAVVHDLKHTIRRRLKSSAVVVKLSAVQIQRLRQIVPIRGGRSIPALPLRAFRSLRRWFYAKDVSLIYGIDRTCFDRCRSEGEEADPVVRKDRLEDFLRYSGSNRWLSAQKLMTEAIRRLDQREHCYTVVEGNVLVHYGWLQANPTVVNVPEVGMRFPVDPNSAVLYDFYTEPLARGRGLYKRTLRHIVQEMFALGINKVLIGTMAWNHPSRRAIEGVGFRLERRLFRRRILGQDRRWEDAEPSPKGHVPASGPRNRPAPIGPSGSPHD